MADITIQSQVSLQPLNTLAIGAKAHWFGVAETEDHIHQALAFVTEKKCSLLVLGGGSNIVLAQDFPGLCLLMKLKGREIEKEDNDSVYLSLAAGENWHETVIYCVENGYYGVENLALIPGTVGAAPMQNIGAYGVELESCFSYLEAIERETGKLIKLNKQDCQFAYRDSIFKHALSNKVIITRVVLQLSKQPCWSLEYPALRSALEGVDQNLLTARQVAEAVIHIRQSKLPNPDTIPNAGSFFKNPIIEQAKYEELKQRYPNLVAYPSAEGFKLAAGWLLDHAGWKGKVENKILMHEKQALVLTNPGKQSGEHIIAFAEKVKTDIDQRYGVQLEIEPQLIN